VFINHRFAHFQFNDESSIDIISKGRTITIKDQEEKNILLIITLSKAQEVEIDSIFNIKNFSPTAFNP